jgi:hypothetical protein
MESPRIATAVRLWAASNDADRPKVTKNLATLIADEVGRCDLENRIRWEIGKLK